MKNEKDAIKVVDNLPKDYCCESEPGEFNPMNDESEEEDFD